MNSFSLSLPKPYARSIAGDWQVPEALVGIPRWLVWRAKPRGNEKADKIPVSPLTGRSCNATDPRFLTGFVQAHDYALSKQDISGLGFSLGRDLGIIGGDLDGCIDAGGKLSELAVELISSLGTYFEISPGGRGLRFFGYARLDKALIRPEVGLEIYCEKRFVTITGNSLEGAPFALENIQESIDCLVERYQHQSLAVVSPFPTVASEDVDKALKRLDPDCGYDDWIRVGMALKSTGDESAFHRFNDWSALGDKYPGEEECRHKWESFSVEGGINIGTLYWMAGLNRKTPSQSFPRDVLEATLKSLSEYSLQRRLHTDVGNTERFADITKGNVRFVSGLEKWISWSGKRWDVLPNVYEIARHAVCSIYKESKDTDDEDRRAKIIKWGMISQSKTRIEAMTNLASKSQPIHLASEYLDRTPHLLGVPNGTVDLITAKLVAPDRDFFITKTTAVPFDPNSQCPRWEDFVLEIMDGNLELANFLQRLAGYSLWGGNPEQMVAILYGTGSNGKSTFVTTLQRILGDYARQIDPASLVSTRQASAGGPRDDLVRLYRARYAVSVESGEGDVLDESLIKMISGGDTIYARGLYAKEGIEFTPEFLLMLATNHKPVIRGTDHAIWRRLILIPFEQAFKDHERDRGLADTLKSELTGIFSWMIMGCRQWCIEGLNAPPEVKAATHNYRTDMDTIKEWIEDRCVTDADQMTPVAELYRSYKRWCEIEGREIYSSSWFGRNLENKGFCGKKNEGVRCRVGLGLQ
ncbi:phage/plasmid primase, P4 family [Gammaproteobacteria bacterium]|nr:phage/plasmid primase, P4 family [Gammaproteobacteria bacterium]